MDQLYSVYLPWMDNVERWLRGEPIRPLCIEIGLTNKCNLRCKYCYKYNRPTEDCSKELSDDEWIAIAHDIADLQPQHFSLGTAGESTLRFGLLNRMARIIKGAAKPINCCITTNGTLFTEAQVKEWVELGWDNLTISIDSPDARANNAQRSGIQEGSGKSFERCLQSLKWFTKWKRALNKKKPQIYFNAVITKNTWSHLDALLDFAEQWGVGMVTFFTLLNQSSLYPKLRLSERETREFKKQIPKLLDKGKRFGIMTNLGGYLDHGVLEQTNTLIESTHIQLTGQESPQTGIYCYAPWRDIIIHPNGLVGACFSEEIMFGNLRTHSLSELWEGAVFENMRRHLLEGKCYSQCDTCCAPLVIRNNTMRSLFRQKISHESKPGGTNTEFWAMME